jgi:hypothetical protein
MKKGPNDDQTDMHKLTLSWFSMRVCLMIFFYDTVALVLKNEVV